MPGVNACANQSADSTLTVWMRRHVAASELVEYLGCGATRRGLVTEVGRDLGIAVDHHDAVAAGLQGRDNGPANCPGTAGDGGDSPVTLAVCGAHGFSTTLPMVAPASRSRWASAASASGRGWTAGVRS